MRKPKVKTELPSVEAVRENLGKYWYETKGREIIKALPKRWSDKVEASYGHERFHNGIVSANNYLLKIGDSLHESLNISASDSDIQTLAERLARDCETGLKNCHYYGEHVYKKALISLCERYEVRYPIEFEYEFERVVARLICSAWWLRQLRKAHARAREGAAIDAGLVHRKGDLYISDDSLDNRIHQIRRNEAHLNGVTLQSESGQSMKLSEISEKTTANQFIRATELIIRARGYEDTAKANNHDCIFITITTPPRMHSIHSDGKPNINYDGTKPNEAQAYLVKQWARCRARLAREGIDFYGLRVAEPHHDATPHWHMTLFYKGRDSLMAIKSAINHYFLYAKGCDSHAEGSIKNRIKYKLCDGRGATGYILKYIMKNMRGFGIQDKNGLIELDDESKGGREVSSDLSANRVEAWASTWAIRQFQAIGGHSVSVWRELRRVKASLLDGINERIREVLEAVNKKDDVQPNFAKFIHAIGGAFVKRKNAVLRLEVDYLTMSGRYGETIARVVRGVFSLPCNIFIRSYREKWEVVQL